MKPLFFNLILSITALFFQQAHGQTDSLSTGDTISVNRQRVLFNVIRIYRYQLASSLNSRQVLSLLKRSPGEDVGRHIRLYKQQRALAGGFSLLSFPMMTSGLILSVRRPETGTLLTVSGLVLTFVAPTFRAERNMERAVLSHNVALRSQSGDYYRPTFDLRPQSDRLTLADTVQIKGNFLRPAFVYRGLPVDPATNLKIAFGYLNSGRINANMRYVRTVRSVAGFLSTLASTTLFSSLLIYGIRNTMGSYPLNRGIVYPALGTIGLSAVINWHANREQLGTMKEYNLKIKERGDRMGSPVR